MKLTKTILSGLLLSISFFGKINAQQCDNSAIDYIYANFVRAAILNDGSFFWNRNDGKFLVPFVLGEYPTTSTIFAGSLWLGGTDNAGNLKTSWSDGGKWYISGPINDNTLEVFEEGCNNFDRIWKITRGDILWVKEDFEDNGIVDLPIPYAVKIWPARGNPFFEDIYGFSLPDQELAPFFDRNNNGMFEPSNGEYPLLNPSLPNAIPNEMTWSVFNSTANNSNGFSELAMGVEIHFMTYAFNCSENDPLNYTVFTSHKIINKSGGDLAEFKIGFWLDPDLGCFSDDYFGCDTTINTQYIYNSDNDDNDAVCNGIGTYGVNPPVQAITFLNKNLSGFAYYNSSFNNPPFGTREPNNANQFYNYLSGRWQDGTPLTYGGSGYDVTGNPIHHVFPDPPNDPNGWNMFNEQLPKYDQRTIMSAGLTDFLDGEAFVLDGAFSYHRQPGADHIENVNVAFSEISTIQEFYNNGFLSDCQQVVHTDERLDPQLLFNLSPNPNNGTFDIFFDKTATASQISVFDYSGKIVWAERVPAHSKRHTVDLSGGLPTGIYFAKWTLADGRFAVEKVVVK